MTAIRAIFDGKAFIPSKARFPCQLRQALVLVDTIDPVSAGSAPDDACAYYQSGPDADDEAWAARATEPRLVIVRGMRISNGGIKFPRRGEVWLVDFPDDPKTSACSWIVSPDARNEFANSILAVPDHDKPEAGSHARSAASGTRRPLFRFADGQVRKCQLFAQIAASARTARRNHKCSFDSRD